jgi:hypothetical protein
MVPRALVHMTDRRSDGGGGSAIPKVPRIPTDFTSFVTLLVCETYLLDV